MGSRQEKPAAMQEGIRGQLARKRRGRGEVKDVEKGHGGLVDRRPLACTLRRMERPKQKGGMMSY